MTRLIRRPWFAVTALAAACVLARLSLSFAQQPANSHLPRQPGAGDDLSAGYQQLGNFAANGGAARDRQSLAAQDAEMSKAIEAYRRSQDEAEKARIAKTLPELVGKQFDARQQIRGRELKQLEQQLHKLQELHQRRTRQRDQIVEERVRQLLRDADGLGWGSDDDRPANVRANNLFDGQAIGVNGPERQ